MKKTTLLSLLLVMLLGRSYAFCGFYVAKADAKLFNKSSQIILVHDGDHTTVTMSSDFQGDVNDFAMVIPVPVLLKQEDIKVVRREIFDAFDAYSGPRLVEYYDQNPCAVVTDKVYYDKSISMSDIAVNGATNIPMAKHSTVKIEAKYTVGEYDIMILSAGESGDLETWLNDNGYKVPDGAKEVLEPYIKSNMKFFVCKINVTAKKKSDGTLMLNALRISFHSPKFMLPIRLGMANSQGSQDMICYAFTKNGRVETTNYHTEKMPTDIKVPEFVKEMFGKFYVDLYKRNRAYTGQDGVFLEYAWDLTGYSNYHCDPCTGPSPLVSDMMEAGVDWITADNYGGYSGSVFFTRLHVTYDREHFPQDLMFEETPNKESYQARYVLTHCASGDLNCDAGKAYRKSAEERRWQELNNLAFYTGWDISGYLGYPATLTGYVLPAPKMKYDPKQNQFVPDTTGMLNPDDDPNGIHQEWFNPGILDRQGPGQGPGSNPYFVFALISMLLMLALTLLSRMAARKQMV